MVSLASLANVNIKSVGLERGIAMSRYGTKEIYIEYGVCRWKAVS